jgi:signal transduction histidine kinase
MNLRPGQAPLLVRLGFAALVTAAAALGRLAMTRLVGERIPFHTFYAAILLSAWYGGLWPGVACTLLSAGLVVFFWLEPVYEFAIADVGEGVALLVFGGTGVAISAAHESLHRAMARLQAARLDAERAADLAQEARREADAANRAKDEFLTVLSHELRTPLTSVLGWTRVLRTCPVDATTRTRALETIERNTTAQARLIEDILDVSRVITGKLRLVLRPTDPAAVVHDAFAALKPAADAKGVALEASLDPGLGMILADPDRLQQIAWNLLSNAVKFTPRGGRVEVRLEHRSSEIQLAVTDTGAGIPADFLPHCFERFRQVDASWTRAYGGLGLGLAIVKHLVDLHGGSIAAESDGEGKGARFTVSLPIPAVCSANEGTSASDGLRAG